MTVARGTRRLTVFVLAVVALVCLVAVGARFGPGLYRRHVTLSLLERARSLVTEEPVLSFDNERFVREFKDRVQLFATREDARLASTEAIDLEALFETLPESGGALRDEVLGHGVLIAALYREQPIEPNLVALFEGDAATIETVLGRWLEAILRVPAGKRYLAQVLLAADREDGNESQAESTIKWWLLHFFFAEPGMVAPFRARAIARVPDEAWARLLADARHADARVRAGSVFLAMFHPRPHAFRSLAREALADRDARVRIAAAAGLSFFGDRAGERVLLAGLEETAWELRWWSALALSRHEGASVVAALRRAESVAKAAQDDWLESEFDRFARSVEDGELIPENFCFTAPTWELKNSATP